MPQYTIHHTTTGETSEFDRRVDVLDAWQKVDADTNPSLVVTHDDGSARLAAHTTSTTDADGNTVYGKSPREPAL